MDFNQPPKKQQTTSFKGQSFVFLNLACLGVLKPEKEELKCFSIENTQKFQTDPDSLCSKRSSSGAISGGKQSLTQFFLEFGK